MSKKNQTFRNLPDMNIIKNLLETFGLENLEDSRLFTREHMVEINTVDKINEMKSKLSEYYLPCKCKNYLEDINEKKCITILRQFVKIHNYKVSTFEKSIKGNKQMIYQLTPINDDFLSPTKSKKDDNRKYVVSFDI